MPSVQPPFPWFFFLFGSTTNVPLENERKNIINFTQYIPQIIPLYIIVETLYHFTSESYRRPDTTHLYILASTETYPSAVMIFICFTEKHLSQKILDHFFSTFEYLRKGLSAPVEMHIYSKKFRGKVFATITTFIILCTIRISIYTSVMRHSMDLCYLKTTVYKAIALLYTISFIDLTEFVLKSLNINLSLVLCDLSLYSSISNTHELLNKLRCIKIVHFLLHKIVKMISESFGWFFIMIFLDSAVSLVTAVFWIYRYIGEPDLGTPLAVIRKYKKKTNQNYSIQAGNLL